MYFVSAFQCNLLSISSVIYYSLRPEILVGEMDESRRILVIDISIFIHHFVKYFGTERVKVLEVQ